MAHLDLIPKKDVSSFRKLAIGTWQTAYDPTVYGTMRIRMEKSLHYIERFREVHGVKLTVTHLVAKAIAEGLKKCPDANAILRFNKIYLRKQVTLSVLVVQTDQGDGKVDLTAARIADADQKSLKQMAAEMQEAVDKVRNRKDKALEESKGTIHKIPFLFMNAFLKLLGFLMYTLNLDLSFLGMPKDAFGGVTITNVGSLGLDIAYVPLVPYTNTPIFIAPGAVQDVPVVEGDKVVPGKIMHLNASFDHRFIDGFHAGLIAKTVRDMMENPFERFDPV
ncbi:MAG: 2-oxo acid dehydrogenase [Archangium gephyra]|uniref:2-oxo acid dehydrogenase n=1 Tax=Archangium gephyra TaxID=48 RepID=A0A2W5T609_9BACT|nr:MAG: 2-oxo acid dehydrogenase [Archangium gephyra]